MEFSARGLFCSYYRFFGLSAVTTYIHLEMISKVFVIIILHVGIGD